MIFNFFRLIMFSFLFPFVAGCGANHHSIYRQNQLPENNRLLVTLDAKQQIILHAPDGNGRVTTCVGSPPDALSVTAASAGGDLSVLEYVSGGFQGASSEEGANIGLRTQTTTTLGNQSFRICEAFMNGALTDVDYAQLVRRNQVMTTAILAIEQLTSAVTGPSAIVGASSGFQVDNNAIQNASNKKAEAEKEKGAQDGKVASAKSELAAKQEAVKTKQKKLEEAKKAQSQPEGQEAEPGMETTNNATAPTNDVQKLEGELAQAKADVLAAQKVLLEENAKLQGLGAALRTATSDLNRAERPVPVAVTNNGEVVQAAQKDVERGSVASVVQSIVESAFEKTFLMDLCQMYWTEATTAAREARPGSWEYRALPALCHALAVEYLQTVRTGREVLEARLTGKPDQTQVASSEGSGLGAVFRTFDTGELNSSQLLDLATIK